LYSHIPLGMPMPYVKRVVKKGYRNFNDITKISTSSSEAINFGAEGQEGAEEASQPPPRTITKKIEAANAVKSSAYATDTFTTTLQQRKKAQNEQGEWFGYAFVYFRDAAEAEQAEAVFNGLDAGSGWTIRILPGNEQKGDTPQRRKPVGLETSADPSLGYQLFPMSLWPNEYSDAVTRHCKAAGITYSSENNERDLVKKIKAHYRHNPRTALHAEGSPVLPALLDPLLEELKQTRWPAVDHRAGVECSHYLVLYLGRPNPGYELLVAAVNNLLKWADPEYLCTMVAVTKNFEGTPHIDARDVTYQYAVSLGSFTTGGELCVESAHDPSCVHVIDIHDKIARIDGRFIHWVRGYNGGDRFSVIYYSTNEAHRTPTIFAYDPTFVPQRATLADMGCRFFSET